MPTEVPRFCRQCRSKVTSATACDQLGCPQKRTRFGNKKPTQSGSWYNRSIWKGNPNKPLGNRGGLREAQLIHQPLCEECLKQGIGTEATVVDHKKNWKKGRTEQERWRLFTDPENHQSLCESHHNSKTAKENK